MSSPITYLCHFCDRRMVAQGIQPRTKSADNFALEYFAGAAQALLWAEHEAAPMVIEFARLQVAPRGYQAVLEIVKDRPHE